MLVTKGEMWWVWLYHNMGVIISQYGCGMLCSPSPPPPHPTPTLPMSWQLAGSCRPGSWPFQHAEVCSSTAPGLAMSEETSHTLHPFVLLFTRLPFSYWETIWLTNIFVLYCFVYFVRITVVWNVMLFNPGTYVCVISSVRSVD